jgi:glycerol-3-phosphate acyltransferase PlsY
VTAIFAPGTVLPKETELSIEASDKTMKVQTISATTVSTHVGAKLGFLTYVLDVLKVFVPVMLLKHFMPDTRYYLIAATTGVVGHIWPLYHRFRGGRGISAIYGGIFAIDWIAVFVTAIGGMLFGIIVVRDLYFTYTSGLWLLIPWLWWRTRDPYVVGYVLIVNILFTISSRQEAREWFRVKHEKGWDDWTEAWQISGMGRGIVKMGRRLGLIKKKAATEEAREAEHRTD